MPTMPLERSWKTRDNIGAGASRMPFRTFVMIKRCTHCTSTSHLSSFDSMYLRHFGSMPRLSRMSKLSSFITATCWSAEQYSMLISLATKCWNSSTFSCSAGSSVQKANNALVALIHSPLTCCSNVPPSQNFECACCVLKMIRKPSTQLKADHTCTKFSPWSPSPKTPSPSQSKEYAMACTVAVTKAFETAIHNVLGMTEPCTFQMNPKPHLPMS
mmetsp:Transcript_9052/g.27107  ORF Transcript_9052/g.27107 Transcript_9052/m.27107 type:complete len:215 (+) Transcript_9052:803-1447(+)